MSRENAEPVADLMREHSSAAQRYAAALARRMGMGTSELAALEHLEAAGTMTPGQLGGRLSMSPGAVAALVDSAGGAGAGGAGGGGAWGGGGDDDAGAVGWAALHEPRRGDGARGPAGGEG